MTEEQREIVELAFENWLARFCVLEGSPEDDYYRAHREVTSRQSGLRGTAPGLVLVGRFGS